MTCPGLQLLEIRWIVQSLLWHIFPGRFCARDQFEDIVRTRRYYLNPRHHIF